MNKILGVFVLIGSILLSLSACTSKKVSNTEQEVCNAEFKLQYPMGIDHVLFTVVQQDPIEYFKKELTADRALLKKAKVSSTTRVTEGTKVTVTENMIKEMDAEAKKMIIRDYWNHILGTVTGYNIWELNNNTDEVTSSFQETTSCSNKIWLVTRMVDVDQDIICWSIPLMLMKDNTFVVTLGTNNSIRFKELEKIYDSIVK